MFALHERGAMLGGHVAFDLKDSEAVLAGCAELARGAPDELVIQAALRVGSDHALPSCVVLFAYADPPDAGKPHADAIRDDKAQADLRIRGVDQPNRPRDRGISRHPRLRRTYVILLGESRS